MPERDLAFSVSYRAPEGLPAAGVRDQARLRQLVAAHYDAIWRFVRRLGLTSSDAEDATQEVLLIADKKLDAIRIGSERSFLMSTAYRVASTHRRMHNRRHEVSEEALIGIEDLAPLPDAHAEQARARQLLDAILAKMPIDLRAVFVLYELEGLTMSEIATELELAPGTVASRLRRARENFDARVTRIELAMRPEEKND